MKTLSSLIVLLIVLLIVPYLAVAEQDVLEYLYEPVLGEQQQSMARRIGLHARNAEFDAATILSQDLLDSAEPLRNEDPATYGQVMINHGVLRVAAGDYLLGLSIIKRGQEFLEASANPFDEILVNGVMAKGICELQLGMLTDAEDTFRRAQHITHRQKGVYNEEQLPVVGYLTATNLRQRNPLAADRQQLFSLRVAEQVYGPDSIEILPTLSRLGSYFATRGSSIPMLTIPELRVERDILFKRAVSMYSRAIEIIEINYGVNDLRLLPTLRGLASTRMLQVTNRRYAEFALKRSLEIVDSNPNSDLTDRAQAMVDLGDLYIITSDEKAAETYLNAWTILQETPETQLLAASLFDSPVRLYPRTSAVLYLDRAPDSTAPGEKLFVELQYDVSTDGRARGVKILDKNIPNEEVRLLRQTLRAARYRPRISNGELVETEALLLRQAFVALNNTPSPDARQEEEENAPIEEVPTEVPSAVPPIEEVPVEQTSEV
jgi:uncharacterized membrane protein